MPTAVSKVNIPTDLHQRARAAVRLVERVTGRRYTFAQFVREAFIAQLAVMPATTTEAATSTRTARRWDLAADSPRTGHDDHRCFAASADEAHAGRRSNS